MSSWSKELPVCVMLIHCLVKLIAFYHIMMNKDVYNCVILFYFSSFFCFFSTSYMVNKDEYIRLT